MNFRNKGSYQRWLGFGHATKIFENTPGNQPITIGGKKHRVSHKR